MRVLNYVGCFVRKGQGGSCFLGIFVLVLMMGMPKIMFGQLYANENSVYQFSAEQQYFDSAFKPTMATAYLWVPPTCKRVRGVIVMNQNVLEQWLGEHASVRNACTENDLAILWCCHGFFVSKPAFADSNIAVVHRILNKLADISGYKELAVVPWLPIGHSMTNMLVRQIVAGEPKHIIAGITMKGGPGYGENKGVPMLCTAGQYMEWNQRKENLLKAPDSIKNYYSVLKERAEKGSAITYLFDPNTGHFDCSEQLTELVAGYIGKIAKLRLIPNVDSVLMPINMNNGWLASLPLPSVTDVTLKPMKEATESERSLPWYPDKWLAIKAQEMVRIDWNKKTQITTFANEKGQPEPFCKRNIVWPIPYKTGEDGVTFTVATCPMKVLPDSFLNNGSRLGNSNLPVTVTLLCGNATPVSGNTFQIMPGRSYENGTTYFLIRQDANKDYRLSVQPGQFVLEPNLSGAKQTISFSPIANIKRQKKLVDLKASSSANLPVRFYVKYGPATIVGNKLTIGEIPVGAKYPVKVVVGAYQWGRTVSPAVQTAERVEQSFLIQ